MILKAMSFFRLIKKIRNFPVYLMDYLGLIKDKKIIYKLRNGLLCKLRGGSTDRFILNEVWVYNSYNPKGFEINSADIVVDIGAHAGVFTLKAAHSAKGGKVYAFEPMKENYALLTENIKLNNLKNVVAFNEAVSDKPGKLKFYVSQSRNKGQNSKFRLSESQKEAVVPKISFKNFIRKIQKIDFLKIDCEGAEYEILFSLSKEDLKKVKKISMEVHNYGKNRREDLAEFLHKNKFKVKLVRDGKIFGRIYAVNEYK